MRCGQLDIERGETMEYTRGKIKTLVVDDSPFVLEGITHLLRKVPAVEISGKASDGIEATHLAATIYPDLVLMDFQMPKMDGLTAARLMREANPEVKIILITAHDLEKVRTNSFFPHVDVLLAKQELPKQLTDAIKSFFPSYF